MNSAPSPIPYADAGPVTLPFRDQRTGVTMLGALWVVIGSLTILSSLAVLCMFVISENARAGKVVTSAFSVEMPAAQLTAMIFDYAIIGSVALLIGIGAIRKRRWVRTIILAISWPWLVAGLFSFASMASLMWNANDFPRDLYSWGQIKELLFAVGPYVIYAMLMVGFPAVFLWFFRRSDVAATIAYFGSGSGWVDHVPLPALVIAVSLLSAAFLAANSALTPAVAFFGAILSGPVAVLVRVGLAITALALAWGSYRQKPLAWWTTLILLLVVVASVVLTDARHSEADWWLAEGYSKGIIDSDISLNTTITTSDAVLETGLVVTAILYLLYAKRFFHRISVDEMKGPLP